MLCSFQVLRRALTTVVAAAIAVAGLNVAVLASPASAAASAQGACPFYGDPPGSDPRWINLDVTSPGWQVQFVDGVPSADYYDNKIPPQHFLPGDATGLLEVDDRGLFLVRGTTSLEYRWYSDTIAPADPATITLDTPYTCSVKYPDPQPQTISGFGSLDGTSRRANQPATLNAMASSGLAVSYSSDTPTVCSTAGNVLSFSRAGTCTVRASQPGDLDWLPAPDVTQTVTVTRVPQVITGVPTYADTGMGTEIPYPPAGETVSSSGREAAMLGIGYSLGGDCSFNNDWDAIRLDRVGTCQVIVIAYGDDYWDETTLIRTFQILPEQVTQTVTVGALADMRVGDAAQTITSTTSSGLPATYTSRTTSVCTVAAGTVTPVAAGTCTVRVAQAGGTVGNYAYSAAYTDADFAVRGAYQAQTLTMSDLATSRLNVTPTVTVDSSTTLPYEVASTTPAVCRVGADMSTITLLDTGTCTIRATADAGTVGADDYTAATPVEKSFTVLPELRTQTITPVPVADTRLDGTPPTLAATASSGLPVTFGSDTTSVCTVTGGQLALAHAGECRITAVQAGGVDPADHKLEWVPQTLTLTLAVLPRLQAQRITFEQPDMLRTSDTRLVTPAVDSDRSIGLVSTTPAVCTVEPEGDAGWRVTPAEPGTCTLTATAESAVLADVEYVAADPVTRSFDVWPAPVAQTITFPTPTAMRPSDEPQELAATSTSDLPIAYTVTTPAVCSVTDGAVTAIAAGTCTVAAAQAGNVSPSQRDVYAAATPVERSFEILGNLVAQTITFAGLADMRVGDDGQPTSATASSGLPVTLTSTTPGTCDVSGNEVVAVAPGECTLRASQTGGTRVVDDLEVDYAAAPAVERTLTVRSRQVAHTIRVRGDHGLALSARTAPVIFTSSAGLPVRVTSRTPGVCVVADGLVRLLSAGQCSLVGTANGDDGHVAAEPAVATFPVWGAPPLPPRARSLRVFTVLGRGEEDYLVTARPAAVCAAVGGRVVLSSAGTCVVRVQHDGHVVRTVRIAVRQAHPGRTAGSNGLRGAGSVHFASGSAALSPAAKKRLRHLAPKLRAARLVLVYGNAAAYGGGNRAANRKLSQRRATAVATFLRRLHVKARSTTVGLGSRHPVSKHDAANRRADIYWLS